MSTADCEGVAGEFKKYLPKTIIQKNPGTQGRVEFCDRRVDVTEPQGIRHRHDPLRKEGHSSFDVT